MSQRSQVSPPSAAEPAVTTLIDELLAEQRQLTAVERFARLHERHDTPLLAPHYRDLIPLTAPRPGEQYAFEVDLDRCSGCKGCVTACHSLNGLDEDESWREVGFLVGEAVVPMNAVTGEKVGKWESERAIVPPAHPPASRFAGNKVIPLQQTVTTACHHCVEPGCLLGCPVLAYDKDPVTGIVRHLDDQCIGCSYCILKCPYEVPKYSAKRGIVRKCDLCHGRLAEGEAPACVQACPNEAIRVTLVKPAEVRAGNRKWEVGSGNGDTASHFAPRSSDFSPWLPDSPDPILTLPTTRYVSRRLPADLLAADHHRPKPAPAHWPLLLMLVLTQAGIGGLCTAAVLSTAAVVNHFTMRPDQTLWLATVSFGLLGAGLLASVFHLGQPRKAWRVWLGWRTSWLSREAIALNVFAGAASAWLGLLWLPRILPAAAPPRLLAGWQGSPLLAGVLVVLGLAAVCCQVMVYADTRREFWRVLYTAPKFTGTTLLLGLALVLTFTREPIFAAAVIALGIFTLGADLVVLKHGDGEATRWSQLRRTAWLQRGPLRPVLLVRLLCGLAGGIALPLLMLAGHEGRTAVVAAGLLLLSGELAGRHLFFTAVAPDKMPGQP